MKHFYSQTEGRRGKPMSTLLYSPYFWTWNFIILCQKLLIQEWKKVTYLRAYLHSTHVWPDPWATPRGHQRAISFFSTGCKKSCVLFPGHINPSRRVLLYRLPGISPGHREVGTCITLSVIWLLVKYKDKHIKTQSTSRAHQKFQATVPDSEKQMVVAEATLYCRQYPHI